mmetsp:Transcript_3146/g.9889  ORF Transcript_3146/g.9889 Transcript_3146/m.9889 type:complete len:251 (-) Transcript_3146:857-1609(-)
MEPRGGCDRRRGDAGAADGAPHAGGLGWSPCGRAAAAADAILCVHSGRRERRSAVAATAAAPDGRGARSGGTLRPSQRRPRGPDRRAPRPGGKEQPAAPSVPGAGRCRRRGGRHRCWLRGCPGCPSSEWRRGPRGGGRGGSGCLRCRPGGSGQREHQEAAVRGGRRPLRPRARGPRRGDSRHCGAGGQARAGGSGGCRGTVPGGRTFAQVSLQAGAPAGASGPLLGRLGLCWSFRARWLHRWPGGLFAAG